MGGLLLYIPVCKDRLLKTINQGNNIKCRGRNDYID
jgi:hypothetical protein